MICILVLGFILTGYALKNNLICETYEIIVPYNQIYDLFLQIIYIRKVKFIFLFLFEYLLWCRSVFEECLYGSWLCEMLFGY